MIKISEIPDTNILEMHISGSLTAEQFDESLKHFETAIDRHGSIRVLERIGELDTPPIPWSKFWEDIKFSLEHISDITHVAVVADQRWLTAYVTLMNPLFKPKLKTFRLAELEAARTWLKTAS